MKNGWITCWVNWLMVLLGIKWLITSCQLVHWVNWLMVMLEIKWLDNCQLSGSTDSLGQLVHWVSWLGQVANGAED